MKIPEPIIVPIIIPTPLNRVILRFNVTFPSPAWLSSPMPQKSITSNDKHNSRGSTSFDLNTAAENYEHFRAVFNTRLNHFLLPSLWSPKLDSKKLTSKSTCYRLQTRGRLGACVASDFMNASAEHPESIRQRSVPYCTQRQRRRIFRIRSDERETESEKIAQ